MDLYLICVAWRMYKFGKMRSVRSAINAVNAFGDAAGHTNDSCVLFKRFKYALISF